jgi:hypothetical protein
MMAQNFMRQIGRDIRLGQEGRVPLLKFNDKMFSILTKYDFEVFMPGETTKILNCQPDSEKGISENDLSKLFMGYRPKEVQLPKNQKRMIDYG